MKVKDFVSMEKSGAMFRLVDADERGYLTTDKTLYEADRSTVKKLYGEAIVVGFAPKGKKVTIYISQE